MCAGKETEIELIREKLFKAGIASHTRRHRLAEALGVSGLELWVENERDFLNASRVYARLQQNSSNSPEAPAASPKAERSVRRVISLKPQPEPASTPAKDVSRIDSAPIVGPRRLELKEASSLLEKGIESILLRESELTGECASLRAKVEDLTGALADAQADAVQEIERRETAARDQAQQLNSALDTLTRERREWQEKLKSSDDSFKTAKEQVGSLAQQLQAQQTAATALKQKVLALERQLDQQERSLFEARKETAAEREARVAAEERAGYAEQSMQTQWAETQELEGQIKASLGSLLARVSSKAASTSREK